MNKKTAKYCFLSVSEREQSSIEAAQIIRRALSERNIEIRDTNNIAPGSEISSTISRLVKNSTLMIADVSRQNPNVYYEIGLAQGNDIPVIVVCKRGEHPAFDVLHQLILYYDTSSKFYMETFSKQLGEAVESYWHDDVDSVGHVFGSSFDAGDSMRLAKAALQAQNYSEAELILQAVLNSEIGHSDQEMRADALHQLGLIAQSRGESTLALRYLQEEIEIIENIDNPRQILSAYANLANVLQDTGDLERAQSFYRRAISIADRLNDGRTRAIIMSNLASLLFRQKRFDKAESLFREAIQIFKVNDDRPLLARAHVNLGNIKEQCGDFGEAEIIFRQALEFFEQLGDMHSASSVMNNLASIQMHRGNYADAELWLRRSLEIKERLGDVRGAATSYQNLANINFRTGRFDEATKYIRIVIDSRQRLGDRFGLIQALKFLANILEQAGQTDEAGHMLREALSIAEEVDSKEAEQIRSRLESAETKNA